MVNIIFTNFVLFGLFLSIFLILFLYKPWNKKMKNLEIDINALESDSLDTYIINSTDDLYVLGSEDMNNNIIKIIQLGTSSQHNLALDIAKNLQPDTNSPFTLYEFTIWNQTNYTIQLQKVTSMSPLTKVNLSETILANTAKSFFLQALYDSNANPSSQMKLYSLENLNIY